MGVSLDKLHGTAAYRDQNAPFNVQHIDKLYVTAAYRSQAAAFAIVGDELQVAGGLTVGTHNITVKATDANGKSVTKVIPITVEG